LTGHLGGDGITLDAYINRSRVVVVEGVDVLLTGNLDLGTSLLAESGNVGTSATDDVSADGKRDGDLDALLLLVSDFGYATMLSRDLLWNQAGERPPSTSRGHR
jgi:hypothetical protein